MEPRRTRMLTSRTATKPLNSLVSPRVSRMMSSSAILLLGPWSIVRTRDYAYTAPQGQRELNADVGPPLILPDRRPLAEEGVDAFGSIGVEHVAGHRLPRDPIGGRHGPFDLRVERPLAHRD